MSRVICVRGRLQLPFRPARGWVSASPACRTQPRECRHAAGDTGVGPCGRGGAARSQTTRPRRARAANGTRARTRRSVRPESVPIASRHRMPSTRHRMVATDSPRPQLARAGRKGPWGSRSSVSRATPRRSMPPGRTPDPRGVRANARRRRRIRSEPARCGRCREDKLPNGLKLSDRQARAHPTRALCDTPHLSYSARRTHDQVSLSPSGSCRSRRPPTCQLPCQTSA